MSYRTICSRPPVWIQTAKEGGKSIKGEVGILTKVITGPALHNKCFLVMEYEQERYIGSLLFNDTMFCLAIYKLLKNHIGWSIQEIGDLDLSYTM
jgi:hypothetical protein